MARTPDDHLKANYAAALVAARLSAQCLVRPVAAGTDVGVDLYCESVAEHRPFLHFWMQVKAGDQCRIDRRGRACARFKRDHLDYWRRQPVPVFAALVPVRWPPERDPDVHLIDVTGYLLDHDPPGKGTVTLWSDRVWRAGNRDHVRAFLDGDVPAATARRLCAMGVIGSLPTAGPEYTFLVPSVPVERHAHAILHQIRKTAAFSILLTAMEDGSDPALWGRLGEVLAAFGDDPHWETFAARGCAHMAGRRPTRAIHEFRRAIGSIRGDPTLRGVLSLEPWAGIIAFLRRQEVRCRASMRAGRKVPRLGSSPAPR